MYLEQDQSEKLILYLSIYALLCINQCVINYYVLLNASLCIANVL